MSDPVMLWQIVAKDPDAVSQFYGKLFGWKVDAKNAMGYREVETGGVKGGIWPSPPEGQNFVQLFVGVKDVEKAVQQATTLGAKVIVPPTSLPDGDVMAVLADPAGIPFGVMRRS